jgi:hypothetical protein
MPELNELKRDVFFKLLGMAGRVFMLVRHSPSVIIGRRGFMEEEKQNGIMLVFNEKMNFVWDSLGIQATLAFGTNSEKCFIPPEDIVALYSPEMKVQLVVMPEDMMDEAPDAEGPLEDEFEEAVESSSDSKVIRVDFKKGN